MLQSRPDGTRIDRFADWLRVRLEEIPPERKRMRRTIARNPKSPVHVGIAGREYLSFCSNDYLGLATHPDIARTLAETASRDGTGSGASHLISGHGVEHHALEEELADFLGRPRALLFSTGYMANLGIASALFEPGDRVFEDRLNHASLIDAGLKTGVRFSRYSHADADALERRLTTAGAAQTWVLTDGVFSMDGDVAPLRALARCSHAAGAVLVVDDAHGFGVLGAMGRGSLEVAGLGTEEVPVLMATLGKALGTFGAFVAGSDALVDLLVQRARTYIYTTAMPSALAAASRKALSLLRTESWRRDRLTQLIHRFRQGAESLGLPINESTTPIQVVVLGNERAALAASENLLQAGLWVAAIRPPTVPQGSSRLRITLSAAHEEAHVDRLLDALADLKLERVV